MNQFFVFGRLGADADLRYTPSGTAVVELSVADTQKKGEAYVTSWWKLNLWAEKAEEWAPHLRKGAEVAAFGRMSQRTWKDKEGRGHVVNQMDEITWFRGCWRPERPVEEPSQNIGPSL